LSILDSFDRAEGQISQEFLDNQIIRGFLGIKTQLKNLLDKYGVKEIRCLPGDKFDPNICEAIEVIEDAKIEEDTIAEIVEKGYIIDNEILRPVKVKVFKKRSQQTNNS